MKKLIVVLAVILTAGCSVIFPKPHDPVMFDQIVYIQTDLTKASCLEPKNWDNLLDRVNHLKIYTHFRDDPQSQAIASLQESLLKAYNSKNATFCESLLKLNRTRVEVTLDAWKGR
jgi:hypothetical protein